MANVQHASLSGADLHDQVRFVQGADPIATAVNNDLWFDTDDNKLYVLVAGAWEGVEPATAGAGTPTSFASWITGRYYGTTQLGHMGTSSVATAVTANRLYAQPIFVPTSTTVDRIGVYLSATIAGSGRLGIYEDSAGWTPGALIVDGGEVNSSVGGLSTVTISEVLAPGRYWVAHVWSAAATPRSWDGGLWNMYGSSDLNDSLPLMTTYKIHAYAALPDPFGAITGPQGRVYAVGLRAA